MACGGPADDPAGSQPDLGGSWQLAEGSAPDGPVPLVEGHPVTLVVEDAEDGLGGTAACNSYGGQYELDGDRITVSELLSTEMACAPPEVMESEQAYLSALARAETVVRDGDRLVLAGDGVELVFERLPDPVDAPLAGTTWVLDTLIEGDAASNVPAADRAVTLMLFEDGSFQAFTGCNTVDGEFVERSGQLDLTPIATTDMACPALGDLEAHVAAVLDGEVDVDVDGDRLTLRGRDGLGLSYRVG